jgi:hypothetical protein
MFLSDPPESDLAEALYDEERASEGYVMNLTWLWCWRPDGHEAFFAGRPRPSRRFKRPPHGP